MSTRQLLVLTAALLAWGSVTASAQTRYAEDFEGLSSTQSGQHGPPQLLAAGWEFRNQSDPTSSGDWVRWAFTYQGRWGLHIDQSAGRWVDDRSEISTWAILPAITGQTAGDEMRFFHAATPPGFLNPIPPTAHLEIRYSPSGGTRTGSSPRDVGDFTVLLADVPDPATTTFAEQRTSIPGGGRIAWRFHIPPNPAQSSFWGDFHIDNLSIGAAITGPPLPAPGETVHWTLAMSPVSIREVTTIPAGGTVVVDPGVVVDLAPTATLTVAGDLIGHGLPGQRVVLQGADWIRVLGSLDLRAAAVSVFVEPGDAATVFCEDVAFGAGSLLSTARVFTRPAFVRIERCAFDRSSVRVGSCALRLTDSTFDQTYVEIGGSSAYFADLTIDRAPQSGLQLHQFVQPVWIDDITITNSVDAGIELAAVNAMVGPRVQLTGNRITAELGGGGLLPGSVLPPSGNTNNYVHVVDKSVGTIGGNRWADTGIPYVIISNYFAGRLDLLPGVRVQLGPLATFWSINGPIEARGTPTAPVLFERFDPMRAWQGLQKFHRFENCVIDGGQIGARFNSSTFPGFIDDCVIRNCDFGTQNDVYVRKTRFIGNDVASWTDNLPGGLDGAVGANSFAGNRVAIDPQGRLIDAQNNWWNDPTGPTAPNNPGGNGEVVLGAGVRFSPFLTAPPNFDDHPPQVHLQRSSGLMEPGSKVLLHWSSRDDVAVVAHRIEFEHPLQAGAVTVVASGLPGTQQGYEWTVPDLGFVVNGKLPRVRVVAVDTLGQEGWDATDPLIPSGEIGGSLTITSNLAGPFLAGTPQAPQLCWNASGLTGPTGSFGAALVLDADQTSVPLGGIFGSCLPSSNLSMPFVSTDTARAVVVVQGTSNRVKHFYSPPFAIRPDPRVGDAPPSVALLTPSGGESYTGGSTVPVTWTASDDEALRSFSIQATYDRGRTWHFLVEDLPGSARQFLWQLPPSSGLADVRVRVIAYDQRFQNTSAGAGVAFSISAGNVHCQPNLGHSGPGTVSASLCGEPLITGGSRATLRLTGAPAGALLALVVGDRAQPTPVLGGTLLPVPPLWIVDAGVASSAGTLTVPVRGGSSSVQTFYLQAVAFDGASFGFSNALQVEVGV